MPERVIVSVQRADAPLCLYPQVAKLKGEGSTEDAANFECVRPGR